MPQEQSDRFPDGACVILYTDAGKVLLQKRDSRPALYPDCWAIFGGGIDAAQDNTPEDTAQRELREELGYDLDPEDLEKLGVFQVNRGAHQSLVHYYRAPLRSDLWDILVRLHQEPALDREGDGLALFSHNEIDFLWLRCEDRCALERHFHGREFGFIS